MHIIKNNVVDLYQQKQTVMNILNAIKNQVSNTIKMINVSGFEILVTNYLIEITKISESDALKIKNTFDRQKFGNSEVFDMSEIGEEGFMLNINY